MLKNKPSRYLRLRYMYIVVGTSTSYHIYELTYMNILCLLQNCFRIDLAGYLSMYTPMRTDI
jgi:hypothetical protein